MHIRTDSTIHRLSRPALNLASLLFKTASFFNLKIKALRRKRFPHLFIISVDNLSFGGTGKTPLVIAIGQALEKKKVPFAVVTRGYRSRHEKKGALIETTQKADEVGDEPWLLKKYFPDRDVIVGRDRLRSIATAVARKNRIVILDDGLQTSQVEKDFSILLINPDHPYFYLRNFKCLARHESLVLVYQRRKREGEAVSPGTYAFSREDFLDAGNRPVDIGAAGIIAFSALGDNGRFENDMGKYHLTAFRGFSDHHVFTAADLRSLEELRREKGATWMVCTEKDFCKINQLLDAASPLIYARNRIELPGDAIEQIIKHAAEKNIL